MLVVYQGVTRPFEDPSYAKKTEDETLLALVDQVIENPRLWFNLDFQTFAGSIPASAPNDNSNMANMMIPTPSYYYRGPPNRPIRNDGGYPCLCGRNGYAEYMIPVCPALHCANNAPHCAVANPYLAPDCYCSCKERVRQMSLPYSQRGLVRPAGPVTKRRNQNSLSDTSMTWLWCSKSFESVRIAFPFFIIRSKILMISQSWTGPSRLNFQRMDGYRTVSFHLLVFFPFHSVTVKCYSSPGHQAWRRLSLILFYFLFWTPPSWPFTRILLANL